MEKFLNRKVIYDGKVVRLELDQVQCSNGLISDREIVRHHGGAGKQKARGRRRERNAGCRNGGRGNQVHGADRREPRPCCDGQHYGLYRSGEYPGEHGGGRGRLDDRRDQCHAGQDTGDTRGPV